jgi:3-deoxy-D-arabino-heptulosonate 7-phosphate (DAHP) synthase
MAAVTTLPAAFVANTVLTAAQQNDLRGAFRVLQVVQATYAVETDSSSATMADTGLTATITPSSTSSKVLVIVNQAGVQKTAGNSGNAVSLRILRGATSIHQFASGVGYTATALATMSAASATYLDSPATVSATTYKTQFSNTLGSVAAVGVQKSIGGGAPVSSITLMEISA